MYNYPARVFRQAQQPNSRGIAILLYQIVNFRSLHQQYFACLKPYAEINNDTLVLKSKTIQEFSRVGFLRKYSTLCNQVSILFQKKPSPTATFLIIDEINEICSKNNSKLIIATLTKDYAIYSHCLANNIELWDIFVPWYEYGLNLLPYDSHPNSKANKNYAQLIISHFEEKELNITQPKAP